MTISTIHVLTNILLTFGQSGARVTNRPANLSGDVFVLEYHNVNKKESRWDRSITRFSGDLERLYAAGFRPVTMTEYVTGKMNLPSGASPVVFTFDDSSPTQFRLLADGSVDPNCAFGIWQNFAKTHPDFPVKATWYIIPSSCFNQREFAAAKIKLLLASGGEIANHTIRHPKLNKLSDAKVCEEFGRCTDAIKKMGATDPIHLALPYGIFPKNRKLVKSFTYKGKRYDFASVVLAGASPAPAPTSKKFEPYRIPRIQAIEGTYGITYWLDKVKGGSVKVYVAP